jgi:hypothetical protein
MIVIAGEGIAAYHAQLTPGTTAPLLVLDGNEAILNGVAVSATNRLIDDLRSKSSGMLSLAADRATDAGSSEEAKRLSKLAAYVREDFGVWQDEPRRGMR